MSAAVPGARPGDRRAPTRCTARQARPAGHGPRRAGERAVADRSRCGGGPALVGGCRDPVAGKLVAFSGHTLELDAAEAEDGQPSPPITMMVIRSSVSAPACC